MCDNHLETYNRKTEICRLCLSYTKVYIYLNQNEKTREMLKSFTSIKIEHDDVSIVCYKCRLNINLVYYIQQNMIKSEEKFQQSFYSTSLVKEENDLDYNSEISNNDIEEEKELENNTVQITKNCVKSETEQLERPHFIKFESQEISSSNTEQNRKSSDTYCKICNRHYINRYKLRTHQKLFHMTIKCPECSQDLTGAKIQKHMKNFHPGCEIPKLFMRQIQYTKTPDTYCKICDRYYINRNKLLTHQKLLHTTTKCTKCHTNMKTGLIQRHVAKFHPECVVPKIVPEKKLYDKNVNAYCTICDRYYPCRNRFVEHVKKNHPGSDIPEVKNYKCETCNKVFVRKGSLSMHIKSHTERICCPKCPSVIRSYKLSQHMSQHHSNTPLEIVTQQAKKVICKNVAPQKKSTIASNNQTFSCNTCSKVFDDKKKFNTHELVHERSECPICGKNLTTINLHHHMSNTHSTTAQQICELCGAILKNRGCLRVHMQLVHQEAQYKCNFCDKLFKRKTSRKQHEIKEHLRQANFVCDTCGKKFYTQKYLKTHVDMKHLKLRPYKCEFCQKSFSSDTAMKTHRRIHTNETPYKCEICGEGFRQKVSLKCHLKSKHNIREKLTVFCDVCQKGFASTVALYSHQRVHE